MQRFTNKSVISPFIAVTYFTVAITGILMLFHFKLPGIHSVHQLGGVVFIFGSIIHLLLNWRIFASYFNNGKAIFGVLAGVLTLLFILVVSPPEQNRERFHGGRNHNPMYESN